MFWRRRPSKVPEAADVRLPEPVRDVPRTVATCEAAAVASPRQSAPGTGWLPPSDRDHAALLPDGIEGGRRLDYPEAAEAFVAWLQANHETGEISRPRLEMLYAIHCGRDGLAMVPSNFLFQAIARLARKHERSVPRRDRKRQRVTTYDIPRQPAAAPGSAGGYGLPAGRQSAPHDGGDNFMSGRPAVGAERREPERRAA